MVGLADPDSRLDQVGRGIPEIFANCSWLTPLVSRSCLIFFEMFSDTLLIMIIEYHLDNLLSKLITKYLKRQMVGLSTKRSHYVEAFGSYQFNGKKFG